MVGLVVAGGILNKDKIIDKDKKDILLSKGITKYTLERETLNNDIRVCMKEPGKLNSCEEFSKAYQNCTTIYINVTEEICNEFNCTNQTNEQENGSICTEAFYTEEEIDKKIDDWQTQRLELIASAITNREKAKATKEEILVTIK